MQEKILHEFLNLGEAMLTSGSEVNRVEDTLSRMGKACGASQMNVFVITSSIVVTMTFPDGQVVTQTRRILNPGGTDFRKLEDFNGLSRRFCQHPMSVEELRAEIEKIQNASQERGKFYLGSMLAAGGFAMFFGGNLADGVMAAVFAVLICFLQEQLMPFCANRMVFNLLCSVLAGLGIGMVAHFTPMIHMDKIMIGDIMLLIPGIAMTNAVRDVLVGDTISGVMRLVETILWAAALACGFMAAIWLIGG